VDTTQLDARFAGRDFDAALLRELPDAVDPCGERGEFHTCVYAGPMFAMPLRVMRGDTVLRDGRFAYSDFQLAASA
jgi:diphthamide synthase (EF-2-diphthine--ammonia ligase)